MHLYYSVDALDQIQHNLWSWLDSFRLQTPAHSEQNYLQKAEIRDIFQMGYVKRKEVDFKEDSAKEKRGMQKTHKATTKV